MIVGLNLDVWDWKCKHVATDVLHKSTFVEMSFIIILGSMFAGFRVAVEPFSTFVALGIGLKFHDFSAMVYI